MQVRISGGCDNMHGNRHFPDQPGKYPAALHHSADCRPSLRGTLESRASPSLRILRLESLWAQLLPIGDQHHCDVILHIKHDGKHSRTLNGLRYRGSNFSIWRGKYVCCLQDFMHLGLHEGGTESYCHSCIDQTYLMVTQLSCQLAKDSVARLLLSQRIKCSF